MEVLYCSNHRNKDCDIDEAVGQQTNYASVNYGQFNNLLLFFFTWKFDTIKCFPKRADMYHCLLQL